MRVEVRNRIIKATNFLVLGVALLSAFTQNISLAVAGVIIYLTSLEIRRD